MGKSKWVRGVNATTGAAIVVTAGLYAAKDCVGGLMRFEDILPRGVRTGYIRSIMITDAADQAVEYNFLPFRSLPSGTFTNDAALDPTDADLLLALPGINIASSDRISLNDNGISSVSGLESGIISVADLSGKAVLYAALQAVGTPTYASTTDLAVFIEVVSD